MKKADPTILENEYREFCQEQSTELPSEDFLGKKLIENKILWDLKYGQWISAAKVMCTQTITGTASLFICPQFHLGLTSQKYVMHTFHHLLGAEGCMIACGSIFLGSGALLGMLLLRRDEIQRLRFSFLGSFLLVAIFAIFSFVVLGAEVYLEEGLWWILGAFLTPTIIFTIDKLIRGRRPSHFAAASLKMK